MKILISCEKSERVKAAFRALGHDAYSCDILPGEQGGQYHIQDDVLNHLKEGWDAMIAFPDCTHLSGAGAHLWKKKQQDGQQQAAYDFVMRLWNAPVKYICIENPQGFLNSHWMRPSQIIEPWQFGHEYKKRTCLWLKNLPLLEPTKIVKPSAYWVNSTNNYRGGEFRLKNGIHRDPANRSRTFQGIADAMAMQWGNYINGGVTVGIPPLRDQ